jgi:signal transduction histidine kinase
MVKNQSEKKIASFLHDNVSAMLSSAGLHLNAFSSLTEIDSEEITKTKAILERAHDSVRDLSHELLPALLVRFGLLFSIEDLCETNSNSTLEFQFSSNVSIKKRYNESFEIRVYS